MAYSRRKFNTLKDAVKSVKCPSQKLVKVRMWCEKRGLDMVIKKLHSDTVLVMVLNREQFRRIIYLRELNTKECINDAVVMELAQAIEDMSKYYLKSLVYKQKFTSSRYCPVIIKKRDKEYRIMNGDVYVY